MAEMFTNNDFSSMREASKRLENAQNGQAFQYALSTLHEYMKKIGMDPQYLIEVERRAYYLPNEYSDRDTKAKMFEAKKRVIEYIHEITNINENSKLLLNVLENFYLFLENLLEKMPHKKGGIQREQLKSLKIKNEYDVQHLLYAYLKPLYPMARTEVNEDTGYSVIRADILLNSENIIEIKCTRKGMALKYYYSSA